MSEIIVKGCIVGLFLFTLARWIYYSGYRDGARKLRDFLLEKLKKEKK